MPPTPMPAMFSFSLGAWAPKRLRGMTAAEAAASAVVEANRLRVTVGRGPLVIPALSNRGAIVCRPRGPGQGAPARGDRALDSAGLRPQNAHRDCGDFPANWLACAWLGAVPTVLAEPSVRVDRGVYWSRLRQLLDRIDARTLVTDPSATVDASWPAERPRFTYEETVAFAGPPVAPVRPDPTDLLLLQHSSGTTGAEA